MKRYESIRAFIAESEIGETGLIGTSHYLRLAERIIRYWMPVDGLVGTRVYQAHDWTF